MVGEVLDARIEDKSCHEMNPCSHSHIAHTTCAHRHDCCGIVASKSNSGTQILVFGHTPLAAVEVQIWIFVMPHLYGPRIQNGIFAIAV